MAADAAREVEALLRHNGFSYRRDLTGQNLRNLSKAGSGQKAGPPDRDTGSARILYPESGNGDNGSGDGDPITSRFLTILTDRGCKWETVFVCRESTVLIYGRYPFLIAAGKRALETCEEINRQVIFGSMILLDEAGVKNRKDETGEHTAGGKQRMAFRTAADLFDAYSAYEQIGRALEYNAGVMVRFWMQAFSCADFSD